MLAPIELTSLYAFWDRRKLYYYFNFFLFYPFNKIYRNERNYANLNLIF